MQATAHVNVKPAHATVGQSFDTVAKKQLDSADPTQVHLGSEVKDASHPSAVDGESHLHLTSATQAEHAIADSQYGIPDYR